MEYEANSVRLWNRCVGDEQKSAKKKGRAAGSAAFGIGSGRWRSVSMTRLTELPTAQATRLAELECPSFDTQPWLSGPPLSHRRLAGVPSVGLVLLGVVPF